MHRTVPGFRALHFSDAYLLDAERDNNSVIVGHLANLLVAHFQVEPGPRLEFALAIAVEAADALVNLAFRRDPDGDPSVLDEVRTLIREYLHRQVDCG